MNTKEFGRRAGVITRKTLRVIFGIIIIGGIATFSFLYWSTYESGVMAGTILRVSKKGVMFKTYEGKINLESFGALKSVSPLAETFDFSIERKEKDLIEQLQQSSLSGERVNLHFVKRYMIFPWRGDTRYFATRVERIEKAKE
ncbi:MAG: hypothetical protein ACFCUU_14040 [Cyclobacteriaceae bacterium]